MKQKGKATSRPSRLSSPATCARRRVSDCRARARAHHVPALRMRRCEMGQGQASDARSKSVRRVRFGGSRRDRLKATQDNTIRLKMTQESRLIQKQATDQELTSGGLGPMGGGYHQNIWSSDTERVRYNSQIDVITNVSIIHINIIAFCSIYSQTFHFVIIKVQKLPKKPSNMAEK